MTRGEAGEGNRGRDGVAMDAEVASRVAAAVGVGVGPVEHDVVGAQEVALGHDLEADAEDVPAIDGVGVWVVDFKGGYGR